MKNKFPKRFPRTYEGAKLTVKDMAAAFREARLGREASKGQTRKAKIAA